MKLRLFALFVLSGITNTIFTMQPAPLIGGSNQEWYKGAIARKLTSPILLRYAYASRNGAGTPSLKIVSIHPGTQKDFIFGIVGSPHFNLFDEPYFSMDSFVSPDGKTHPSIIFRAANNQVYFINFQKLSNYTPAVPLYSAVLERISNTGSNAQLRSADARQVLQALQGYIDTADHLAKEPVDNLVVVPGEVLTVLADDNDVYLSKGNK
jgi:hypothetical protein